MNFTSEALLSDFAAQSKGRMSNGCQKLVCLHNMHIHIYMYIHMCVYIYIYNQLYVKHNIYSYGESILRLLRVRYTRRALVSLMLRASLPDLKDDADSSTKGA